MKSLNLIRKQNRKTDSMDAGQPWPYMTQSVSTFDKSDEACSPRAVNRILEHHSAQNK